MFLAVDQVVARPVDGPQTLGDERARDLVGAVADERIADALVIGRVGQSIRPDQEARRVVLLNMRLSDLDLPQDVREVGGGHGKALSHRGRGGPGGEQDW